MAVGEHLTRSIEVTDATAFDRLTATLSLAQGDSSDANVILTASVPVTVGADGVTRAEVDAVMTTPGSYTANVRVCRAGECTTASFAVTVPEPNHAPTASVDLTPAEATVLPTATLTARATSVDPDGDDVTLTYRWLRNSLQELGTGPTLELTGLVQPGDTITVEVTASDGTVTGGAARSSIVVSDGALALPTITATATTAAGPYAEGSWSSSAVTVVFDCQADVGVTSCTPTQTVSVNTPEDGLRVIGTVVDATGLTATTSVVVQVDRTAPTLAPTVTPDRVVRGKTAIATAHAGDALSGVAAEWCDTVSTASLGRAKVTCYATDAAGNEASATVEYLVLPTPASTRGGPKQR